MSRGLAGPFVCPLGSHVSVSSVRCSQWLLPGGHPVCPSRPVALCTPQSQTCTFSLGGRTLLGGGVPQGGPPWPALPPACITSLGVSPLESEAGHLYLPCRSLFSATLKLQHLSPGAMSLKPLFIISFISFPQLTSRPFHIKWHLTAIPSETGHRLQRHTLLSVSVVPSFSSWRLESQRG